MSQLELVQELRANRPVASAELRERVLALAPPPPPRRIEPNLRRLVPAVAFAGLAAAVGVATVVGVVHGSHGPAVTSAKSSAPVHGAALQNREKAKPPVRANPTASLYADKALRAVAPSTSRLQQYDASCACA